jgi:predicted ArsR family transcriptional regulator
VPSEHEALDAQIEAVAALGDPVRRSLFRIVSAAPQPLSRDDAAASAGISRALAAFHLDKLVAEGLLDTSFRRLTGRTGPGAGRPAKLYERSAAQVELTLPERRYELAARLLLAALTERSTQDPISTLAEVAHRAGLDVGEAERSRVGAPRSRKAARERLLPVLERQGYEPYDEDGRICLRNCPFHSLVAQAVAPICTMNLGLIGGVLDGLAAPGLRAELGPADGRCCVVVRPEPLTAQR